jgi:hypothetical protein
MCSGSCGGKRENCPAPQACGWPEETTKVENDIVAAVKFMLAMIGLIVFCFGVVVWL